MALGKSLFTLIAAASVTVLAPDANAQIARDTTWDQVTTGTAIAAGVWSLVMPRVFYASPEETVGWKARWHASVLAPIALQTGFALVNEYALKAALKAPRPGCEKPETCDGFAMFSTQTYAASAAFGHGTAIFVYDMMQNNGGRFHAGALVGNVIVPLALAGVTVGGRLAGNWENADQVMGTAGLGLLTGALLGTLTATLSAPACGYSGNLICW